VAEDERALGEVEEDEAGADEDADALRVAHGIDRLAQDVEEGHGDDDAAGPRRREQRSSARTERRPAIFG
jgi:hypothetical protein